MVGISGGIPEGMVIAPLDSEEPAEEMLINDGRLNYFLNFSFMFSETVDISKSFALLVCSQQLFPVYMYIVGSANNFSLEMSKKRPKW